MLFLLFGPPGVGKSTLCEEMSLCDLEAFRTTEERVEYANIYANRPGINIAGAADLNPSNFPRAVFIALKVDEKRYQDRRLLRDKMFPDKANQPNARVADFVENIRSFDIVVNADNDSSDTIHQIMQAISAFCKQYELNTVLTTSDVRELIKKSNEKGKQ